MKEATSRGQNWFQSWSRVHRSMKGNSIYPQRDPSSLSQNASKNRRGERSGEKHNSGSHIWREILSLTLCPFRFAIKRRPTGQCSPSFSVGLIQFRAVSWTNRFLWFALQRSLLSTLLHCRATVQVTFDRPLLVLISAAATPPWRNNSKMVFRGSNAWGGCKHNCAVLSGVIRTRAAEC